jgi:hypothetical protein
MTQAPFHNEDSFERAIIALIDSADEQERGQDLDRLYNHVMNSPDEVNNLASFVFMLDDDFRPRITQAVDAYRRWCKTKGRPCDDQTVARALVRIYRAKRGIEADAS